jgi:ATP-dependent HslUV protease subunit HslV
MSNELTMHATTIITVRKGDKGVIAGDGQVSLGQPPVRNCHLNRSP